MRVKEQVVKISPVIGLNVMQNKLIKPQICKEIYV